MMHLIKYEWKKTLFLKLFLLAVVLIGEAIFLYCAFTRDFDSLAMNVSILILSLGLMLSPIISILQNLSLLQRELNCKEAYMLYLTPHNSFEILGTKYAMNFIEIFFWAFLASVICVVDVLLLTNAFVGLGSYEVREGMQRFVELMLSPETHSTMIQLTLFFLAGLLQFESIALLAIVLQSTFLPGKRFGGVITVILYIALNYFSGALLLHIPFSPKPMLRFGINYISPQTIGMVLVSILLSVIYFILSAILLEKKRNI
jgi:hypothetical protein